MLNILVIDDDDGDRMLCRTTLRRIWDKDFGLSEAPDGEAGLALLEQNEFDCVLLDHSLPGINGIEVLKRIRARYPNLPVVMLDGKGNDVVAVLSMKEGAQDYLAKSTITPATFERAIVMAIESCRMKSAAKSSDERYRSIFGAVGEAIFVIDAASGLIEEVNDAALAMLDCPALELIGRHIGEFSSGVPPCTPANATDWIQKTLTIAWGQRFEWDYRAWNGKVVSTQVSNRQAVVGGRNIVLSVARDLTQQKQAQAHLEALQGELAHFGRLSVLGEMAAAIGHEINQPLSAAANYTNAARRRISAIMGKDTGGDMAEIQAAMAKAAEQIVRAGKIIGNLRDMAEKRDGQRGPESLNTAVEEALSLGLMGAAEKNVEVCLALETGLAPVMVDKIQIQQVVINLIRNSLDAMSARKGGKLTVSTGIDGAGFAHVTVKDTGGGLPADVMAHLFQPFKTTKAKGMGIGLTISQSIAESHGGKLRVLHNDRDGAAFRLTIPLADRPMAAVP